MSPAQPLLTISAITLLTDDLAASKAFYTTAFGAQIAFEDVESCAVRFNNLVINLLASSAGADLVGTVAPRDGGKRVQLSVWVNDLDSAMERLQAHGVKFLTGPEVKPWRMRTVTFEDPSGHSWEIGQQVRE